MEELELAWAAGFFDGESFVEIGKSMGRDHSTIRRALKRIGA